MSTTKTAKKEISIDGFSKYMMSWFDYNKWTVNSNALLNLSTVSGFQLYFTY